MKWIFFAVASFFVANAYSCDLPPEINNTCDMVGQLSAKMVEDKSNGVTYKQELSDIKNSPMSAARKQYIRLMAKQLYHDPNMKLLSPQGAQSIYLALCLDANEKQTCPGEYQ